LLSNKTHSVKPPFSTIYHGAQYRFPAGNCSQNQCHGSNLTGGNSTVSSCLICHDNQWNVFSTTHTVNVNGYFHHASVENGNFAAVCGTVDCHGDGSALYTVNKTGYNYRYACLSCHNPIPAPGHTELPPFSTFKHAKNYRFPTGTGNCTSCHGSNLNGVGGSTTTSCYKTGCHGDVWSLFLINHTVIRNTYYHHTNIGNSAENNTFGTCASTEDCHGASLTGGINSAGYHHSCTASICHTSIPGPFHTANKDGVRHRFNVNNFPDSSCTIPYCHGSPNQLGQSCNTNGCHD
jgi:hypothetical protein